MGRGGIASRKAMEEKLARATKYRLTGVAPGSRVSECLDKYGRWKFGYRTGTIVRNTVTSVSVQWDGDADFTYYTAGDARYEVDRDRWHILPPKKTSIFDVTGGSKPVKNGHSTALTGSGNDGKIDLSPPPGAIPTEERSMATRSKSKTHKVVKDGGKPKMVPDVPNDELDDELDDELEVDDDASDEVDDEVDDTKSDMPDRDEYTAKQVATRIGTDAKTLRKFFRSSASTVEPVGQGGRYVFDAADMPKIKKEFDAWNSSKTPRTARSADDKKSTKKPRGSRQAPATAEVIEDDDEVLELEDDELEDEPTDDELDDIENDDELDDEDDE